MVTKVEWGAWSAGGVVIYMQSKHLASWNGERSLHVATGVEGCGSSGGGKETNH